MGEVNYKPLIDDMTWSYSRVECFNSCPYRFFLKYIKRCKDNPRFYSSYGSFMHKLLERYYLGELTKDEMLSRFLLDFSREVQGDRPAGDTVQKYIKAGVDYLKSFEPFPFNMVAVEKEVHFDIGGYPFVGFIDYLGEKDGKLHVVDNKSRDLKPRSGRAKPTLKDRELDDVLRQLYIYAGAVKQEYGAFPETLCLNCFRTGVFIEEPFSEEKYNETVDWVVGQIRSIGEGSDDFYPNIEFYSCFYICGVREDCLFWEMR